MNNNVANQNLKPMAWSGITNFLPGLGVLSGYQKKDLKDAGMIQALVGRFKKQRLPRILELKEKVDSGRLLDAPDIAYMEELLYNQSTQQALENEK